MGSSPRASSSTSSSARDIHYRMHGLTSARLCARERLQVANFRMGLRTDQTQPYMRAAIQDDLHIWCGTLRVFSRSMGRGSGSPAVASARASFMSGRVLGGKMLRSCSACCASARRHLLSSTCKAVSSPSGLHASMWAKGRQQFSVAGHMYYTTFASHLAEPSWSRHEHLLRLLLLLLWRRGRLRLPLRLPPRIALICRRNQAAAPGRCTSAEAVWVQGECVLHRTAAEAELWSCCHPAGMAQQQHSRQQSVTFLTRWRPARHRLALT